MDAGGLGVGILALAGVFNNAVDCFEYVQLGRDFGKNFQTSMLKLENARLILSRWGQAIGLSGDLEEVQSLQAASISTEDKRRAEELLGQILSLFKTARRVSMEFESRTNSNDSRLILLDEHTYMDPCGQSVHQKMRGISKRRQNRTSIWKKTKWALYEEKHLKKLIEDIIELVNMLVHMFSAVLQKQQNLCELEISEIGVDGSISVLKDIAASQDKDLEAAILKLSRSTVSH